MLVGIGTALADDPLLTNRSGSGRQPARVVLDSKLRISLDSQLIKTANLSPVLIATTQLQTHSEKAIALRNTGAEIIALSDTPTGLDIPELLDELGKRNWTNLLVEAGPALLGSIIHSHLADELQVYVAPATPGPAQPDLPRFDINELAKSIELPDVTQTILGPDTLLSYVL